MNAQHSSATYRLKYFQSQLFLPASLPLSIFRVKPHRSTVLHSSFFCLSHSSISLCTLNLLYISSCLCRPFRWSHGGSSFMTPVVYSAENIVYSVGTLFCHRERRPTEKRRKKGANWVFVLVNPDQRFFFKDGIWVIVNLELLEKEETHAWVNVVIHVRIS